MVVPTRDRGIATTGLVAGSKPCVETLVLSVVYACPTRASVPLMPMRMPFSVSPLTLVFGSRLRKTGELNRYE